MARLVFTVNSPDFLVSHRLVLVRGALQAGYDVHAVCPDGAGVPTLSHLGVSVHQWAVHRTGQRALREVATVARLVDIYRRIQPDIVHHVTIKPVIYGSFAARVTGVRGVVNAVSGLGYVFLKKGLRAHARRRAIAVSYRLALNSANTRVVLQNDDDEHDLRAMGALGSNARVVKVRGSGVDLKRFRPTPEPVGVPVVVFPARFLRDKGVIEFVHAARHLRASNVLVRMVLVGDVDTVNPASVTRAEVESWVREGCVEWWGFRTDMPQVFSESNIVCLPSYREGIPKVLLEAAASGRAIVTTDAPGARDVVAGGRLGPLVPAGNWGALADAIEPLLDATTRSGFASALAEHARRHFSDDLVLAQHLRVYEDLLA